MINIEHENNNLNGVFLAVDNHKTIGEMSYVWAEEKMIIDHTEVHSGYEGKGVGTKMVMGAVNYARIHQVKILPLCPFAKSVFDRKPEIGDVKV